MKINAKPPTGARELQLTYCFYLQQRNLIGQLSPTCPCFLLVYISFQYMYNKKKNPWVAKQLLSITEVRWDKSHPERQNDLSRRKSWGSAGTWIWLSPLPVPHLLPCVTHHLVYHLKPQGHTPSVPNTLWFGSSQQESLPRFTHTPLIPTFLSLCSSSCFHLSTGVRHHNCASLSNCDRFSLNLAFETNDDSNLFQM